MISAILAKATMPICVPDTWSFINLSIASWATVSRLGLTSVAHILRETSRARMMVVRLNGTSVVTAGRAMAVIKLAVPIKKKTNGKCCRQRVRRGIASRIIDRLEYRIANFRLRLKIKMYTPIMIGITSKNAKYQGQIRVMTNDLKKRVILPLKIISREPSKPNHGQSSTNKKEY